MHEIYGITTSIWEKVVRFYPIIKEVMKGNIALWGGRNIDL